MKKKNVNNVKSKNNKGKRFDAANAGFIASLALFVIIAPVIIKLYLYNVGPDEISYTSIAFRYLQGDFQNAVNGYWGPLYSWLLIPFLAVGIEPFLATRILQAFCGIFVLFALKSLSSRFEMSVPLRIACFFAPLPIIFIIPYYMQLNPDLLFTGILIYYLSIIFNDSYAKNPKDGIICGLLGGAAYLTKSYALPFFALHFVIFNILQITSQKDGIIKKKMLISFVSGFIVFALIVSAWSAVISKKYGFFTMSTTGRYNYYHISPESGGVPNHPMHYLGFLPPANSSAISVWEDPTYITPKMKPWSAFASAKDFSYQIWLIGKNTSVFLKILIFFSIICPAILLIAFFLLFKRKDREANRIILYSFITSILYASGYLLIVVVFTDARYFLLVDSLCLLMAGQYLTQITKTQKSNSDTRQKIIAALLAVSFIVCPFIFQVRQTVIRGNGIKKSGETLKRYFNVQGKIASNSCWHVMLYMSTYMGNRYYGEAPKDKSDKEIVEDLKKNGIDYYFVWEGGYPGDSEALKKSFPEITKGKVKDLKIYKISQN